MDFDLEEYGGAQSDPEPASYSEAEPAPPQEAEEPQDDGLDAQMSEAEGRLHKAMLYRQFLTGSVFDGDQNQLTAEVEDEFRAFARHQLAALLGVGSTVAPFGSPFTDDQVKVLRLMADKTLQNASVRNEIERQSARQAPAPQPAQKPKPQPPKLRQRTVAEPARPSPKPTPAVATPQRQRPGQKPQRTPPPPALPGDGEMITLNNKHYKVKWVQMRAGEYGGAIEQQLLALPRGSHVILPNGIQVHRTVGDEFYKIIRRDLTVQARAPGAMPFPNAAQMAGITAAKAHEAVASSGDLATNLGARLSD
jgi:hypothetical protein